MTQRTLDAVQFDRGAEAPSYLTTELAEVEKPLITPRKGWVSPVVFLLGDCLSLLGAVPIAGALFSGVDIALLITAWLPLALVGLIAVGSYTKPRAAAAPIAGVRGATALSIVGMGLASVLTLAGAELGAKAVVLATPLAVAVLVLVRALASAFLSMLGRTGVGKRPVVVIGTPREARAAAEAIDSLGRVHGVAAVVTLADSGQQNGASSNGHQGRLEDVLQELGTGCEFVIASPASSLREIEAFVRSYLPPHAPAYVDISALLQGPTTGTVDLGRFDLPALRLRARYDSWHYTVIKRGIDIIVASVGLILAAPIMAVIALAIKLDSPGPVLFRQTRVGHRGRPFVIRKFRSMRPGAEEDQERLMDVNEARGPMFKIRDDPRTTRVGRIIRRLSLDELPQLINVLEGSMSLVGPRPPLPQEVMQYQPEQLRRLELKPGITGLWQVCRTDLSSFDEMVSLDLTYIDRWSLGMDLKIILKTPIAMILARGAY